MKLLEKKSGQATLIIIMVTLAAVVGVAATASTQTSFSFRNTVYGVQSEQALACAEAGAERILGEFANSDDPINGGIINRSDTLAGSECQYEASISDYPDDSGAFTVPRLSENTVIQLNISREITSAEIEELIPLNAEYNGTYFGDVAIYVYSETFGAPKVTRRLIHCGDTPTPTDFENGSFRNTEKLCGDISLGNLPAGSTVRIRALNNDFKLNFNGFTNGGTRVPVGNYIESTGKSGTVQRKVTVFRFYRQLPDFFDETIAVLN